MPSAEGSLLERKEYVLVTPARNEESYIRQTIEAVLSQTILPSQWVIVSDGSTDRTDEIVALYASRHTFIQLLRVGESGSPGRKDFGSKVRAFRAGYSQVRATQHQFVGNIDADVTFESDYFARILEQFERNPRLGLAGGLVFEPSKRGFIPQRTSLNSVCGSVQLFRRECYEAFGGYVPMRFGGVDAAAEIMARMQGWMVQTFPEITVYARRPVLTGSATILQTRYRQGMTNYLLGYHPLFQLASSISRISERPVVFGSMCALLGYVWSWARRSQQALPVEVGRFLRSEQLRRLANYVRPTEQGEAYVIPGVPSRYR